MPDLFHSVPEPCEYIPEELWRHMVFWLDDLSPSSLDILLELGFRHFGNYFFRNDCLSCNACLGIRIPVKEFTLSKSQKRLVKKNCDLNYQIIEDNLNDTDKSLISTWQKEREESRDWTHRPFSTQDFKEAFAQIHGVTHLVRVFDSNNKLVALSIIDKGEKASNSIYAVFHPNESKRSLGTYLGVVEIEWAKSQNIKHHYLGHYNDQCQSLTYKNRFRPYQLSDYSNFSRNDILKILSTLPEFDSQIRDEI